MLLVVLSVPAGEFRKWSLKNNECTFVSLHTIALPTEHNFRFILLFIFGIPCSGYRTSDLCRFSLYLLKYISALKEQAFFSCHFMYCYKMTFKFSPLKWDEESHVVLEYRSCEWRQHSIQSYDLFAFITWIWRHSQTAQKSWLRLLFLLVVFLWRHQNHDHANYDQVAPNFDMTCKTLFYWSFPYNVNKNMIMQIIINLLQILIWPVRLTACPCTKFEVNWTNEHRVTGKRSWIISVMLYGKMGWWAFFHHPQYKCMEIF